MIVLSICRAQITRLEVFGCHWKLKGCPKWRRPTKGAPIGGGGASLGVLAVTGEYYLFVSKDIFHFAHFWSQWEDDDWLGWTTRTTTTTTRRTTTTTTTTATGTTTTQTTSTRLASHAHSSVLKLVIGASDTALCADWPRVMCWFVFRWSLGPSDQSAWRAQSGRQANDDKQHDMKAST